MVKMAFSRFYLPVVLLILVLLVPSEVASRPVPAYRPQNFGPESRASTLARGGQLSPPWPTYNPGPYTGPLSPPYHWPPQMHDWRQGPPRP
ncbi:hypothetical protein NMG60_11017209 [Bertholletia excelsa]